MPPGVEWCVDLWIIWNLRAWVANLRNMFNHIKTFTQKYRMAMWLAAVGLLLTWGVFLNAQKHVREKIEQEFRWQIQERRLSVENSIKERLFTLRELQALYAASKSVERDEFQTFTKHFFKRFPTGVELAWVPWVTAEQRLAFEQNTQKELPNFAITERTEMGKMRRATQRQTYFPIIFTEPYADLLSFDLASSPVLLETLEQARDTGQKRASKIFTQPIGGTDEKSLLVALPIYHKGLPTKTLEQRREHLSGFYVAIISIHDLIEVSLSDEKATDIHFWLQETATDAEPFYVHISRTFLNKRGFNASSLSSIVASLPKHLPRATDTVTTLNRQWLLSATLIRDPTEYSLARLGNSNDTILPLSIGLLATLLISGLMVWLQKQVDIRQQITEQLLETKGYTDSILRSMADALLVISPKGQILSVNQAACTLLGHSSETLTGLRTGLVFEETIIEHLIDFILENHNKPGSTYRLETTMSNKDETKIPVLLSIAVMQDANQNFIGTVCVAKDITERKQAEKEINQAFLAAQSASMAKSNFIANMSHEIRTPMNAIIGLSHLAIQSNPPPKLLEYLQKIKNSSRSLLSIINDVLDFSKMEANSMKLKPVAFYLADLFDRLGDLFSSLAADKGIELLFSLPKECDKHLFGDSSRLEKVLINLIGNAIKFTDTGSIMVRVRTTESEHESVQLAFSIQDTGIGIVADIIKTLFEPFVQGDGSSTRKYAGTGLGLSICKQLLDLMGGEIWVESTQGIGSTFHFSVIVKHQQGAKNSLEVPTHMQGMRVLVVDDHPLAQEIATEILSNLTFAVTLVNSAAAAINELMLARIAEKPYALMLVDWQMPVVDGIKTIRQIRTRGFRDFSKNEDAAHHSASSLKIILLTALGREHLQQQAKDVGANLSLNKPVSHTKLWHAIMAVFGETIDEQQVIASFSEEEEMCAKSGNAHILLVEDNDINKQLTQGILQPLPKIPGIDWTMGLQRVGGDQKLYRKILLSFHEQYSHEADNLNQALADGDLEQGAKLVHKMKGIAGNLGVETLYQASLALEKALHQGDSQQQSLCATAYTAALHELLNAIVTQKEYPSLPSSPETPPKEEIAIDPAQLKPLLTELTKLLTAHNLETDTLMAALKTQLQSSQAATLFRELEKAINNYDFDVAKQNVAKIADLLDC